MSICVCLCVYVCDGWMFHPSDLSAPFRSQTNQTKKNWAQHQELGKIIYHFNDHTFSSSGGTHSRSRIDILGNFVKFHIWTSSVWMFLEVNDQFCITIFPRTYVWGGGCLFRITNCVSFTSRAIVQKPTSVALTVLCVFSTVESFVEVAWWLWLVPYLSEPIHSWYPRK